MVEDDQTSSPGVNRFTHPTFSSFFHATPSPRYGFNAGPRDHNPNLESLRDCGRSCGLRFSMQAVAWCVAMPCSSGNMDYCAEANPGIQRCLDGGK